MSHKQFVSHSEEETFALAHHVTSFREIPPPRSTVGDEAVRELVEDFALDRAAEPRREISLEEAMRLRVIQAGGEGPAAGR